SRERVSLTRLRLTAWSAGSKVVKRRAQLERALRATGYQGPSGRPTKALHTPDFLVLRKDGASFEEWKPEEKLLELMVTHPGRYQRDDSGTWRCPPGEAAAAHVGLSYRVRSSAELHPGYIRNLIFLDD